MVVRGDVLNILHVRKHYLGREESLATCQRKSPFGSFFSKLIPRRNGRRNKQESLDQLRIISKVSNVL